MCLCGSDKVCRSLHFPAGSRSAVGMDDACRVNAEAAADDGL